MHRWVPLFSAMACASFSLTAHADKAACISAADQGQQLRDDGKYRAARERFVTCSKAECPKVVAGSCSQWLRDLDGSTPSLVLGAKDPAGGDLTDVRVSFDGDTLATSLDGKPVLVDPGSHRLRFERAGSEPVELTILIRAGEKNRGVAPTLRPPAPVKVADTATAPEVKPTTDGSQTARFAIGGTVLALAAGALATGIYFGVSSQNDADQAAQIRAPMPTSACIGAGGSTPSCVSLASAVDAQNRDATLNVAMYVVSGVLAAAGVLTLVLWPKHKHEAAWLAPLLGRGSF